MNKEIWNQKRHRRGAIPCGLVLTCLSLTMSGCTGDDGSGSPGDPPLAGGETTIVNRTSSAFENPAPNLTAEDLEHHLDGDVAFEATFVSTPADVNPGLGPVFNNSACGSCHIRNGRGLPITGTGPLGSLLLVRVSAPNGTPEVPGGPVPVAGLGTQLQDHAIYGETPETTVQITWIEQADTYPADGAPYSLRRPVLDLTMADGSPLPGDVMTSARIPPPVHGLGLLEAIPEDTILALADPDDDDGDGISGRVNRVWSVEQNEVVVGRFGWKANTPTLLQQAAAAYKDDMGISTPMFLEADSTSEVNEDTMVAAAFYTQTLAVPRRATHDSTEVIQGEDLFRSIGCAGCHTEELQTGDHQISALRDQTIHPYTDLLLHNMGFDLTDGRPDFQAAATEWRTPPLWGIGLTETVLGAAAFLHDGRARTLSEAILWHGGEAEASKESFRAMSAADRAALIAFLHSL